MGRYERALQGREWKGNQEGRKDGPMPEHRKRADKGEETDRCSNGGVLSWFMKKAIFVCVRGR